MGTRSLTHFINTDGKGICTVYRQYDGYPSGHGRDLFNCLGHRKLVNGYNDSQNQVNGMTNAAAMLIANTCSATECGEIYVHAFDSEADMGQDYTYTVSDKDGTIWLRLTSYGDTVYDGRLANFNPDMNEEE